MMTRLLAVGVLRLASVVLALLVALVTGGGAVAIGGGEDMWNLLYFTMAPLQSLTLLQLKLAAVHDPDAIGLRVFFDIVGALIGACLGWAMFSGGMKRLLAGMRSQ